MESFLIYTNTALSILQGMLKIPVTWIIVGLLAIYHYKYRNNRAQTQIPPSASGKVRRIQFMRTAGGTEIVLNPPSAESLRATANIQLLLILPSLALSFGAVLAGGALGRSPSLITELFLYSMLGLPLALLIAGLGGRILLSIPTASRIRAAWVVTRLMYGYGIVLLTSFILLYTVCGGKFGCR